MRYGSDRGRFHEITGKRAVEDKDLGPLVKTVMTRCIHCTRCVRFANEVAGVDELGTTGRGNSMQIGTYVQKVLNTEMSGNVVDLCPVGALTAKPYAFQARPWELKKTESIDVLDGIGSNIRIDSRGTQVMRIQPRLNDDVNEEWLNDKSRWAHDGLRYQRLTTPLIREGDRFVPASWPEALERIAEGLQASGAQGNEIKAIAGSLADTESLVALKDLINKLGSDNTTLDTPVASASVPPATGVDLRSNYTFNSTIPGAETADALLLVGTNPRHEGAILNTRLRKAYLNAGLDIGLIGQDFNSTFEYENLGQDLNAVKKFLSSGKGEFAEKFKNAKKPMIIVGSGIYDHADGPAVLSALSDYVVKNKDKFVHADWNGFNVLQRVSWLVSVLRLQDNRVKRSLTLCSTSFVTKGHLTYCCLRCWLHSLCFLLFRHS
jgi:NADH dehydrogenase (ubiquinone) Fe-S protein 1